MKKLEIRLSDSPKALREFARGIRRTSGTLTEDEAALVLEDSEADFVTAGVAVDDVVHDITTGTEAMVAEVAPGEDETKLVLAATLGASEDDVYEVSVPPIPQDRIVGIWKEDGGKWMMFYYKDDGIRDDLGKWLSVDDPTTADTDEGVLAFGDLEVGFVKLYELPSNKSKHEISLSLVGTDTAGFQYTASVWGLNSLPAEFTDDDYLSRGVLLVPEFTLALDPSLCTVPQSLVESKVRYLAVYVADVTQAPDQNIQILVKSFNDGDEVV